MNFNLQQLSNNLNRKKNVKELNKKDMDDVNKKQTQLLMKVTELAEETKLQVGLLQHNLMKPASDYNNNSYIFNKSITKEAQKIKGNSKLNKLNNEVTVLIKEIYNDLLKLRNNEYKYQTLNSKEKVKLEEMIVDYNKKFKEIENINETYSGGYLDKYLDDTESKIRNRSIFYVTGSASIAIILAISIYIYRKK